MTIKKYFFYAITSLGSILNPLNAEEMPPVEKMAVTRVIFDVGSGSTKVLVADVDPLSQKILQILDSKIYIIPFSKDMTASGEPRFSDEIQKKTLEIFTQVKNEFEIFHPTEWSGIATASARKAENGQDLFNQIKKELGIDIAIIPASEEARLGFLTALASSGLTKENLISYDSGSGSFQIASEIDGKFEIIEGNLGIIPATKILLTEIRGLPLDALALTPNPISIEEAAKLVLNLQKRLPNISQGFKKKLKDSNASIVGIGNETFIFYYGAQAVGKNTYTKEELWDAIQTLCGKTDQELPKFAKKEEGLVGIILLYSVMDGLGIQQITFSPSHGSCEGLAVDEKYWKAIDSVSI